VLHFTELGKLVDRVLFIAMKYKFERCGCHW
jgi:hypothetical protein